MHPARRSAAVSGFIALAAGIPACAAHQASAREAARYVPVGLTEPVPYDAVGIYTVNVSGAVMLIDSRNKIESDFVKCLGDRGFRVATYRDSKDHDDVRWLPKRDPADSAVTSMARALAVRGMIILQVLETRMGESVYRRASDGSLDTYETAGGMALDARLADGTTARILWARKAGPAAGTPALCQSLQALQPQVARIQ